MSNFFVPNNCGSLTLIFGGMVSAKTETLKSHLCIHSVFGHRSLLISNIIDNRDETGEATGTGVLTGHNKYGMKVPDNVEQIKVKNLRDISEDLIDAHDIIAVDEAQFFKDILIVIEWLLQKNKTLYIAGLMATSEATLFGDFYKLIPYAQKFHHLTAVCVACVKELKHPTFCPPAFMSRCLKTKESEVMVGASNYIPVCLKHWRMDLDELNQLLKLNDS